MSVYVFVSLLFGSLELRGDTLQHNAERPFDSGTGGPPSEFCADSDPLVGLGPCAKICADSDPLVGLGPG